MPPFGVSIDKLLQAFEVLVGARNRDVLGFELEEVDLHLVDPGPVLTVYAVKVLIEYVFFDKPGELFLVRRHRWVLANHSTPASVGVFLSHLSNLTFLHPSRWHLSQAQ